MSDADQWAGGSRPAIFLDRDGTVLVERNHLADPREVQLISGAASALRDLKAAGYTLVLVTNQSGIGRGYFSLDDFRAVQRRTTLLLKAEGILLDAVYYCPHSPESGLQCACRKPELGLFLTAAMELGLDTRQSAFIGDRLRDVLPARRLGGRGILVLTGHGKTQLRHIPEDLEVAADIRAAADLVLSREGGVLPAFPKPGTREL